MFRRGIAFIYDCDLLYQSYRGELFRHLGRIQPALDAAETHGFDEIALIKPHWSPIQNPQQPSGEHSGWSDSFANYHASLPCMIAGGLESAEALQEFNVNLTFERFLFSSAIFFGEQKFLAAYANRFGKQSIIGCIPVTMEKKTILHLDLSSRSSKPLTDTTIKFAEKHCDEVLIHDIRRHGTSASFDFSLLESMQLKHNKTIIMGGVGDREVKKAKKIGLAAAFMDNAGLHHDHS